MDAIEKEVDRYMEAGIVKTGYDPRNCYFYASGNFLGVQATAYISEEEVDWSTTSQQVGEAMVVEKLYKAAREAIRVFLRGQEEGKMGFGFVR